MAAQIAREHQIKPKEMENLVVEDATLEAEQAQAELEESPEGDETPQMQQAVMENSRKSPPRDPKAQMERELMKQGLSIKDAKAQIENGQAEMEKALTAKLPMEEAEARMEQALRENCPIDLPDGAIEKVKMFQKFQRLQKGEG